MLFPVHKKRKLSPLSPRHRNSTYVEDTAGDLSQDSLVEESAIVLGNGGIRGSHTTVEAMRNATTSWSGGTYNSNMFTLKANELFVKVRPDYEGRMVTLENCLRKLKDIIERIPDREAKPVCGCACFLTESTNT